MDATTESEGSESLQVLDIFAVLNVMQLIALPTVQCPQQQQPNDG